MRLFGGALYIGVPRPQQQTAGRTNARANQAKIGSGIEQAGIPLLPARQELIDLITQAHEPNLAQSHRSRNERSSPYPRPPQGTGIQDHWRKIHGYQALTCPGQLLG